MWKQIIEQTNKENCTSVFQKGSSYLVVGVNDQRCYKVDLPTLIEVFTPIDGFELKDLKIKLLNVEIIDEKLLDVLVKFC